MLSTPSTTELCSPSKSIFIIPNSAHSCVQLTAVPLCGWIGFWWTCRLFQSSALTNYAAVNDYIQTCRRTHFTLHMGTEGICRVGFPRRYQDKVHFPFW